MDSDEKQKQIRRLKTYLLSRGINPDNYISAMMAFQKLLCNAKSHDELEVISKVLMAMNISIQLRHATFHAEGGQDERASFELN